MVYSKSQYVISHLSETAWSSRESPRRVPIRTASFLISGELKQKIPLKQALANNKGAMPDFLAA